LNTEKPNPRIGSSLTKSTPLSKILQVHLYQSENTASLHYFENSPEPTFNGKPSSVFDSELSPGN